MTLEPKEKCKNCSLFFESALFCAHLKPDELCALSDASSTATLKRGESLEDEQLDRWPVVAMTSGVLSLQHLLHDGRKSIAAFFMKGDIIDLRDSNQRQRGELIALANSDVCRLSVDVFESIARHNADAQHIVWNNLREQCHRAVAHSADLSNKQALEKLASFLFECRYRGVSNMDRNLINIPIRRCDMAEYMGMQPETISRCFKLLEDAGTLKMLNLKTVEMLDPITLQQLANGDRRASPEKFPPKPRVNILRFG